MKEKLSFKKLLILVSPLLMFAILLVPYSWANQAFIVDLFGCGCPKVDEFGNIIHPDFNANDFTRLFWLFISICTTVISVVLSGKILREKMWFRVLYVLGMLAGSLLITHQFCQMMMWK